MCKVNGTDANSMKVIRAKEENRVCSSDGMCHRIGDNEDAGFGDWSAWSQCTASCGGGQQYRTRICERINCEGTTKMARACNTQPCKGNSFRDLIGFTGNFTDEKRLTNKNLIQFSPPSIESNLGDWSCWSEWSPCSVSCGVGKRTRNRHCLALSNDLNDNNCEGASMEYDTCEMPTCDCKYLGLRAKSIDT